MEFITATFKNFLAHGITPDQATKRMVQITEENKNDLGTTILDKFYVMHPKIEMAIIPADDYFAVDVELYSDSRMVRAEIGDWVVVTTQKYRILAEVISDKEIREHYDLPEPIEEPKHDKPPKETNDPEVPSQVVDEIIPEMNDGTV